MSDVTRILSAIENGDRSAADELLPLVYDELRRLAAQRLAHENPGQTLQPTALVHEAYLRLVDVERAGQWDSRGHFFAAAAQSMRRILVERARRKQTVKHGGEFQRQALSEPAARQSDDDLIALDEALNLLAGEDPLAARVVELRYFGCLGHGDVAKTLEISVYRARQSWTYAKAFLRDAVAERE